MRLSRKRLWLSVTVVLASVAAAGLVIKKPLRFEVLGGAPAGLPVFMFHENDATELDELFGHLSRNGYETLDSAGLIDVIAGRRPYTGREVVLTFDDGKFALWSITYPLLVKHGLKGIAFVNPGLVPDGELRPLDSDGMLGEEELEQYCNWAELSLMSKGVLDLGNHSHEHNRGHFRKPINHGRFEKAIRESLERARRTLVDRGLSAPRIFCAPFGEVSPGLLRIAADTGHELTVGVRPDEEGVFFARENGQDHREFVLRMGYRSILSLPGEGREGFVERIWRRLRSGGDRLYGAGRP